MARNFTNWAKNMTRHPKPSLFINWAKNVARQPKVASKFAKSIPVILLTGQRI